MEICKLDNNNEYPMIRIAIYATYANEIDFNRNILSLFLSLSLSLTDTHTHIFSSPPLPPLCFE